MGYLLSAGPAFAWALADADLPGAVLQVFSWVQGTVAPVEEEYFFLLPGPVVPAVRCLVSPGPLRYGQAPVWGVEADHFVDCRVRDCVGCRFLIQLRGDEEVFPYDRHRRICGRCRIRYYDQSQIRRYVHHRMIFPNLQQQQVCRRGKRA